MDKLGGKRAFASFHRERERESREMESSKEDKVDQVDLAIQQLNQLEALQGDNMIHQLEPPASAMETFSTNKAKKESASNGINEDDKAQAIIKHLKDIKRQNFITQCLVSAMIVLTVTWQLSEVSLVLKVQNRITHPFKSLKDMFRGVMKGPPNWNIDQVGDKQKNSSSDQNENEGTLIPTIKLPELPSLGLDSDEK